MLHLDVLGIQALSMQVDLLLVLNVDHLIFQVLLNLLILAELLLSIPFGLHAVLALVFIDDITPETVLLFLVTE